MLNHVVQCMRCVDRNASPMWGVFHGYPEDAARGADDGDDEGHHAAKSSPILGACEPIVRSVSSRLKAACRSSRTRRGCQQA